MAYAGNETAHVAHHYLSEHNLHACLLLSCVVSAWEKLQVLRGCCNAAYLTADLSVHIAGADDLCSSLVTKAQAPYRDVLMILWTAVLQDHAVMHSQPPAVQAYYRWAIGPHMQYMVVHLHAAVCGLCGMRRNLCCLRA